MAPPSEKVQFISYGFTAPYTCSGCGRPILLEEARWWRGHPKPAAVFADCCFKKGAQP